MYLYCNSDYNIFLNFSIVISNIESYFINILNLDKKII